MIEAIRCHVPAATLSNDELVAQVSPSWSAEQIYAKTGIRNRHVLGPDEQASDMAFRAAERVLEGVDRAGVDMLLFCTEAPDYALPATACLLQERLGLGSNCGALDFNLGCSGYVYGLALAGGLLTAGTAKRVLLLTADAYSKMLDPADASTRALFGDAASATLLSADCGHRLHSFALGSDGAGARNLIFRGGGFRKDENGAAGHPYLCMNGPEIFNFTLRRVPETVAGVLGRAGLRIADVDHFVFHQANGFILGHLQKRLGIPREKMVFDMEDYGNTVSSSIPLCLEHMLDAGRIRKGDKCMLLGFGVGLSFGGCILEW